MARRPKRPGPKPRAGATASAQFHIRLTEPELSRWREAAEGQNLTLAEFVREAVETAIARGSTR